MTASKQNGFSAVKLAGNRFLNPWILLSKHELVTKKGLLQNLCQPVPKGLKLNNGLLFYLFKVWQQPFKFGIGGAVQHI